jgi:hypothetical protein
MNWFKKVKLQYIDWRINPKRVVENTLMESLMSLRRDLAQWRSQAKDHVGDPLWNLIRFFNAVSARQDRKEEIDQMVMALSRANYGQHTVLIQTVRRLQGHFEKAGRDPHGMNRTTPGQTVVDGNVFLGGVYGTMTFSVSQWKQTFALKTKDTEKAKLIIYDQAESFIIGHSEPLMDLIDQFYREMYKK